MTEERKHEIESIINNALTDEDCKEWAAGNMTDNVSALVKEYNIKQLNIWDDVCEIVELYPEPIEREATWDYPDQDGKLHVETIETWEWSDELNRYVLVYLEEKETKKYIPFNESDYIKEGVTIPTRENENGNESGICDSLTLTAESEKHIVNKADDNGNIITGYEEILTGTISEVEADYRAYHNYDGPIDIEPVEQKTLNNINDAYIYVRQCNEELTITKDNHKYLGHDNKMYPARATLIIENDGNYYVTGYDYFDFEKNGWVNTEDSSRWTVREINDTFFPYEIFTREQNLK